MVTSPASQLILQPFRHITYITAHSPTLSLLHLRHSPFSNPSVASPTSQPSLQPFRCFTYFTAHSPTLLSLLLHHRLFTYVTWRADHAMYTMKSKETETTHRNYLATASLRTHDYWDLFFCFCYRVLSTYLFALSILKHPILRKIKEISLII